jgi:hypothetical protein
MSIVLARNPAWAGAWAGDAQAWAMTSDVMAGSEGNRHSEQKPPTWIEEHARRENLSERDLGCHGR